MKTLWKSIIICFVCIAMVCSLSSPVSAKDNTITYTYNDKVYTITTSDNGNNVTTVNVKSDDGTSTVILDKKTNVAKITEVNAQGTIVLNKTVNLVATATKQLTVVSPAAATLIASGSEWMWLHSYYVYQLSPTYYSWFLYTANGYKNRQETSSNTGDLTGFKDDVNSAAINEAIAESLVGTGVLAAIVGALNMETVTIGLIIGLLVLLGATIAAAAYIFSAWVYCKDANYHYARV